MGGDDAVRALPLWAGLPLALLGLIIAIVQMSRTNDGATRFVIIAITLRTILSAMHDVTFKSSPLGLSWNAVGTIVTAFCGLLVIRRNSGFGMILGGAIPILIIMVVSTLSNSAFASGSSGIAKICYLIVLATLVAQSAESISPSQLCMLLVPVVILPLLYQIVGIPLGVFKAGESDGSASYIGGFNHEAAYSVLLLGSLFVICFADTLKPAYKIGLIGWCLSALFLANYRTSILAVGPLVIVSTFYIFVRIFDYKSRYIVGIILVLGLLGGALTLAFGEADRFKDLSTAMHYGTDMIQRPGAMSPEYRQLLSGRPAIWSRYIYGWVDADNLRQAVGFGPETWTEFFKLYAHNTLVSALFEVGVLGVAATLLLWLTYLVFAALASPTHAKMRLVAAHISFFILNMATMPMWMIEGLIFYALMVGLSVHYARVDGRAAWPEPRRSSPTSRAGGPIDAHA